jgi:hypothetical protein
VDEFWRKLGPISDRRTARTAAFAEQLFEKSSVSTSVFAMLQDGSVFDLEPEGSKTERKRLNKNGHFRKLLQILSSERPRENLSKASRRCCTSTGWPVTLFTLTAARWT